MNNPLSYNQAAMGNLQSGNPQAANSQAANPRPATKRQQINHPELLRLLMTSETAAMPSSLTNPALPRAVNITRTPSVNGARANGARTVNGSRMPSPATPANVAQQASRVPSPTAITHKPSVIHPAMERQLENEKKLVFSVLGAMVGVFMLLVVAARCFASETVPPSPIVPASAIQTAVQSKDIQSKDKGIDTSAALPAAQRLSDLPPLVSAPSMFQGAKGALTREARMSTLVSLHEGSPAARQPDSLKLTVMPNVKRVWRPILVLAPRPPVAKVTAAKTGVLLPQVVTPIADPIADPVVTTAVAPVLSSQDDPKLKALFATLRASFWKSENQLQAKAFDEQSDLNINQRRAMFLPTLTPSDPIANGYYRACEAADSFLSLLGKKKVGDDARLAPVLYLGGLAHYTLGHKAKALEYFTRLQQNFPGYKRDQYLNDRENPHPEVAVPVAASLAKLVFFLRLQSLPKAPADAFASLQQVTNDALTALSSQKEYARWVAARSDKYNVRHFDEALFGGEPDQRRASALPSTLLLVQGAWDGLLPQASQKSDGKAVRKWLGGMAQPNGLLSTISTRYLGGIEILLTGQLQKDAEAALAAKQYDRAKTLFARLRADYPESANLTKVATNGLGQVTQGLREEADTSFDMRSLKPQAAALQSYQKVLDTTESPLVKGYSHFRMADAMGTMANYNEGIAHLEQAIAAWNALPVADRPMQPGDYNQPRPAWGAMSDYYIEDAYFYLGFYYGAGLKDRNAGIASYREFIGKFPDSKWAPEALHNIMLWYRWSNRPKEAAEAARDLVSRYPNSTRASNARDLLKTDYAGL